MIQPTAHLPLTLSFPAPAARMRIWSDQGGERPVESLAAPSGVLEEILHHHGMMTAAEREYGRLLPRMEAVLTPVA